MWVAFKKRGEDTLGELLKTHSETNRELLAVICACTGPVGIGLGAVHIECGGRTWPKNS